MLNPWNNARAAKVIYDRQGIGAWYGTSFLTDTNKHYTGKAFDPGPAAKKARESAGRAKKVTAPALTGGISGGTSVEDILASMQEGIDVENERRGSINSLLGEQNLQALQGFGVGAAQHPLLGISSPSMPSLAQMLPMLSPASLPFAGGNAQTMPGTNTSIVVNGDIVNVPRGKRPVEVHRGNKQFEARVRRARARGGIRPMPSV
jgi:hypothetical protein